MELKHFSSISSFPKIFHIGENYIENLFKDEVEITEKVDGSQWCFGVNADGEMVFRSKGEDLTDHPVPKMFTKAKEQTDRIFEIIKDLREVYFYCEFLEKPKHNVLCYGRIPLNNLYLFAVKEGQNFVGDFNKLCEYADKIAVERPNLLFKGAVNTFEDIAHFLEKDSVLGVVKTEGIVVKNYEWPAIIKGMIIPISMGKYVREDFKEKHGAEWKGTFTSKGKLEVFIDSFKTEARWQKAIQHLAEKAELLNSPKDIGKLMAEINRDILEEEEENIKQGLYNIFKGDITRKATRGFPEFYKQKLLANAFNKENELGEVSQNLNICECPSVDCPKHPIDFKE